MRRIASLLAVVMLALGLLPLAPATALTVTPTDPDRRCGWPINYPADANYAFPDTSAAYFVQSAILGPGDEIIVTGRDPEARYWSMQTYRFTGSMLLDSVNDVTVQRTGTGASATWTVRVVSPAADTGSDPNVLTAAGDGATILDRMTVLIYRVYASRTGELSGGELPDVTLKHAGDGHLEPLTTCVGDQVGPPENRPSLVPAQGVGMEFVRGGGSALFASADASYLVAQAPYRRERILVVTGKAPRVPKDVRYWSVCQNVNAGDLPVVDCVRDDEIRTDRQGTYAIAVVGTGQVAKRSAYRGVTFLDWGDTSATTVPDAFLIYRNVLPRKSFAGSVAKVPLETLAKGRMGAYAPRLVSMSMRQFTKAYGARRG